MSSFSNRRSVLDRDVWNDQIDQPPFEFGKRELDQFYKELHKQSYANLDEFVQTGDDTEDDGPCTPPGVFRFFLRNKHKYTTMTTFLKSVNWSSSGRCALLRIRLQDEKRIDTIVTAPKGEGDQYASIYLSCQVGCSVNAPHYPPASEAFVRNLTSFEIIEQAIHAMKTIEHSEVFSSSKINSIHFLENGEPLHNYDAVVQACHFFETIFGIENSNICISTYGVASRLPDLLRDLPNVSLSVRLHAPTQTLRLSMINGDNLNDLESLVKAVGYYTRQGHYQERKKLVVFEYVMIYHKSCALECAHALGKLCSGKPVIVNLIPYVPWSDTDSNHPPSVNSINMFKEAIEEYNVQCRVQLSASSSFHLFVYQKRLCDPEFLDEESYTSYGQHNEENAIVTEGKGTSYDPYLKPQNPDIWEFIKVLGKECERLQERAAELAKKRERTVVLERGWLGKIDKDEQSSDDPVVVSTCSSQYTGDFFYTINDLNAIADESIGSSLCNSQKEIDRMERNTWEFIRVVRTMSAHKRDRVQELITLRYFSSLLEIGEPSSKNKEIKIMGEEETVFSLCLATLVASAVSNITSSTTTTDDDDAFVSFPPEDAVPSLVVDAEILGAGAQENRGSAPDVPRFSIVPEMDQPNNPSSTETDKFIGTLKAATKAELEAFLTTLSRKKDFKKRNRVSDRHKNNNNRRRTKKEDANNHQSHSVCEAREDNKTKILQRRDCCAPQSEITPITTSLPVTEENSSSSTTNKVVVEENENFKVYSRKMSSSTATTVVTDHSYSFDSSSGSVPGDHHPTSVGQNDVVRNSPLAKFFQRFKKTTSSQ